VFIEKADNIIPVFFSDFLKPPVVAIIDFVFEGFAEPFHFWDKMVKAVVPYLSAVGIAKG